ncbi:hypothetical protein Tco_0086028 [Tanacetum coccineum]
MDTLEQQLTKETILESNCQNAFRVLKTQFEKIFTFVLIKPSSLDGTYARKDFHAYTGMEPQLFKEISVANDTSCLVPQQQKASDYDNSGPLDILFGPLYDEFFTAGTSSVNKSSSPTDNSKQQDTPPTTNIQSSTEPTNPTNVNADENNDNQAEDTQFHQDKFINPFCKPVREIAESSSRNIDNSNMHTFYQPHDSEYRWIKDHPQE